MDAQRSVVQDGTDGGGAENGDPNATDHLLDDDLLVEEVSIDGMCGVY
jgi:mycofactocin precursor